MPQHDTDVSHAEEDGDVPLARTDEALSVLVASHAHDHERSAACPDTDARYSIIVARSSWYEMAIQRQFDPHFCAALDMCVCVQGRAVLHAVPCEEALLME